MRKIFFEEVESVYTGKAGACCCGCAGKHTYPESARGRAMELRGWGEFTDSELSDRVVKRLITQVNRGLEDGRLECEDESFVSVVSPSGGRVNVIYFKKK